MSKRKADFEVFLSYAGTDRDAAESILRSLTHAGLRVFDPGCMDPGIGLAEAIWDALAMSDAIVAVIPKLGTPNPNTSSELGAAIAWRKPIYLVSQENGRTRVPAYLSGHRLYPLSRIDDVARAIKRGPRPLTTEDRESLKRIYLELEIPTDRFINDPALLDKLASKFNARVHEEVSGERLLYEMIRLRKQGSWPRLQRSSSRRPRN